MSTTPKNISLDVSILGREYRVACPEAERERLLQSATFLDRKMREVKEGGKVSGVERIAVMAALNIAHDYISTRGAGVEPGELIARLTKMTDALDRALESQDNLL
ncbi:MAG: cell division protein ZapA [Betaproteobacteria bacterium]|nr:MAG: cell division protein ZapA [Betaproteobacteria bacterium]